MASQVRFQMLSGICEHIDKTVMAPTTWMPCITHHIYAIDFQLIFFCMQMKHMYICWIAGFCIWPTTSQDRFIMDWADFQRALQRCHSVNPLHDNLWVGECVCVRESVLAVCAVSVVFEQRIHAAKIRGHLWHLTPINQTSAEFYSLSVSLFLSLPPLPVLFRWLAVFTWWSSLALGTGGRGIREGGKKRDEVGRKEKNRQWPWLGRWVNDQTSWQLCVCVCVFMPNVCVSVR